MNLLETQPHTKNLYFLEKLKESLVFISASN